MREDRPDQLFDESELVEPDHDDAADELDSALRRVDLSVLRHPSVLQAIAILTLAIVALVWPNRTDRVFARLIAVGAIVVGIVLVRDALRGRSWSTSAIGGLSIGGGVFVLLANRESPGALGLLIGVIVVGFGLQAIWTAWRHRSAAGWDVWPFARGISLVAIGALLVVAGESLLAIATSTLAIGAAVIATVAIARSLDTRTDGVASVDQSQRLLTGWLRERPKDADDRRALYAKLLFEGPTLRRRLARFAILMAFASVIASMGVITDSTAVVIGAMLIAPLMTPLMATSMSLIMGWPRRLRTSALIALLGIGLAILIGLFLGAIVPAVIDTETNSQILARSSPTTLDLITALAAGAAGAYGLSRPDVSDSLPGVAIAISLVPPLTVVGIAYSQGDVTAGNGALLLFATNALAILVMGGVTFVMTGVTPIDRVAENQRRLRTWFASLATLGAAVVGALFINGATIARNTFEFGDVERVSEDWVEQYADVDLVEVRFDGDVVTAIVVGPPRQDLAAQDLADALADELGRTITADVRHLIQDRTTARSG